MWADNNIVRTLSNFHSPEIVEDGLMRKKRVDNIRQQHQTPVPCHLQNKSYSETFHLIDKGNGAEAKYDISLESHTHGWTPKMSARYFNIGTNNAYKIYESLVSKYTPHRRFYDLGEAIREAAHALIQKGEQMRQQQPEHPPAIRDLRLMWDTGSGRKLCTDAEGDVAGHGRVRDASHVFSHQHYLKKKCNPWRVHQSVKVCKRGKCAFKGCPNISKSKGKRKRSYDTHHKCEQCSAALGKDVFLCNDVKKDGTDVRCHMRYHAMYHCWKPSVNQE